MRFVFKAFFTHDWGEDELGRDNHARVRAAAERLAALGHNVWLDEVEMDGSVRMKMSEGIRDSECVVFFITQRYLEKASGLGPNGLNDNWFVARARARAPPPRRRARTRRRRARAVPPRRSPRRRAARPPSSRAARSSSTWRCGTRARRTRSSS